MGAPTNRPYPTRPDVAWHFPYSPSTLSKRIARVQTYPHALSRSISIPDSATPPFPNIFPRLTMTVEEKKMETIRPLEIHMYGSFSFHD